MQVNGPTQTTQTKWALPSFSRRGGPTRLLSITSLAGAAAVGGFLGSLSFTFVLLPPLCAPLPCSVNSSPIETYLFFTTTSKVKQRPHGLLSWQ